MRSPAVFVANRRLASPHFVDPMASMAAPLLGPRGCWPDLHSRRPCLGSDHSRICGLSAAQLGPDARDLRCPRTSRAAVSSKAGHPLAGLPQLVGTCAALAYEP